MKNNSNLIQLAIAVLLVIGFSGCMGGKGGDRGGSKESAPPTQQWENTSSEDASISTAPATPAIEEHPVVNVYLENSGSMNGYVDNGKTLFQQDVYNYLCDVEISGIPSAMNLHFINSQIINKGSVIEDFINKLTPSSFKSSGGSTATTDIAAVFKQVLAHTDDNTVSIFISDCIFSPGSVKSPDAYLANQQVGIKKCVADYLATHTDFAILVYQLYSNFDGIYYDYKNRPRKYTGERPYYIWVMGNTLNIAKLRAAIPNTKFSGNGVANVWCAYNREVSDLPYAIVPKAVQGDFERKNKTTMAKIKRENGGFAFKITAELGVLELLLGNDYLMDTNNYSRLINKQDSDEWYISIERNTNSASPATHNITLGTNTTIPQGNLSVAIRCMSPKWAYDMTDIDDTQFVDGNERKTYGLKYMFDGIQQAFVSKSTGVYTVMDFKLQ